MLNISKNFLMQILISKFAVKKKTVFNQSVTQNYPKDSVIGCYDYNDRIVGARAAQGL